MTPSPRRLADERRIRRATLLLASGALVGTGIFSGLAAAATHASRAGTARTTPATGDDSTQSPFSAPDSVPTPSYSPPVAQSGGS